jgi:hypothetical protein
VDVVIKAVGDLPVVFPVGIDAVDVPPGFVLLAAREPDGGAIEGNGNIGDVAIGESR